MIWDIEYGYFWKSVAVGHGGHNKHDTGNQPNQSMM